MKTAVDIRALTIRDLNAIESIERRSYPTPWSRSMFAGELAKPASLCLGAFEDDRLAGYLITSRYVDAWHVMNIAVNPSFRRRGIATALLERLFELTDDGGRRGYTLEVRVSNNGAIKCTSASVLPRVASAAATTPTTARTRLSCGAIRATISTVAPNIDSRHRDVVRRDSVRARGGRRPDRGQRRRVTG